MTVPLLSDIVIIFGLSIGVLFVSSRLRIPSMVGFLLTGVLAAPYGLGLIRAVHEVEVLAEVGVVLLLFTVGMEFSFKALLRIKKSSLLGGPLRVLLTILIKGRCSQGESEETPNRTDSQLENLLHSTALSRDVDCIQFLCEGSNLQLDDGGLDT